jgi:hypothetical protein
VTEANNKDYRVGDDAFWARAWVAPLVLAIAGGVLAVATAAPDRLGYAYLTAAHWGVSSRRIVEVIMSGAPVVALLALPFIGGVALGKINIYDEWQSIAAHGEHGGEHGDSDSASDTESEAESDANEHGMLELGASVAHAQDHGDAAAHEDEHSHTPQETALHHEVLSKKTGYLNTKGWAARGIVYLFLWSLIALAYFGWSRRQDKDCDPKHTLRMQSLAASAVSILALTILIGLSLYKRGLVGDAINPEHFHDLGKLLFGFICFWTYVSFSQWMLIWYAGIPEEATWYHRRWEGGWQFVAYLLIFGHFVAPFVLLISRVQKRALRWLQVMCFWVIFVHIVDIYWFVMPQAGGFSVQPADVGALLFVGGVFFAYVFWQLGRVPLLPVGDPRLQRSLHHHQTH